MNDTDATLIELARTAAASSYAPYSGFHVGAALRAEDGTVFTGANVENRSYGLTICAERSAVGSAVTAGHQRFTHIAVFSPEASYPLSPCGACRQVLSEFMQPDGRIIFVAGDGTVEEHTVADVFPFDGLHELRER